MITGGTYLKAPILSTPAARELVCTSLFAIAAEQGFTVRAWAVMLNHYHLIFSTCVSDPPIKTFVRRFHGATARELNRLDGVKGRKVWFQYWDSHITYEASMLARLRYVHTNPEHHGVVRDARNYPWCSAAWFAQSATPAFVQTVNRMKTDKLTIPDDY
jgi:putative transposase